MIGVKIKGRLGNQMFQYAFAYAQAKKHSASFFLFNGGDNYELNKYFELRPYEKYLLWVSRAMYKICYKKKIPLEQLNQSGWHEVKEINKVVSQEAFWDGFFQSDQYFYSVSSQIKKLFLIKKKYKDEFLNKYDQIFDTNKVLVLHFRRTDYLIHGSEKFGSRDLSLPMVYYNKCLSLINNWSDYYIIVLSDDIEYVRNQFVDKPNFHFEHNEQIIDFQIMQHADKLIISNSTFAWWAAYLNKKNVKAFAPKYWLGFHINQEYPKGIMTNRFNWVSVYEK